MRAEYDPLEAHVFHPHESIGFGLLVAARRRVRVPREGHGLHYVKCDSQSCNVLMVKSWGVATAITIPLGPAYVKLVKEK
eukprot:g9036.t1